MQLRSAIADWKLALIAALALLGLASFIVFVIRPGGFEGQIAWFFGLLPGAVLGLALADHAFALSPALDKILLWPTVLGLSLLWYFAIALTAIKMVRFFSHNSEP